VPRSLGVVGVTWRERFLAPQWLAAVLAWGFLALALFVPLAAVVARGLGEAPWDAMRDLFQDPFVRERVGVTLLQATLSTGLTLLVGVPGALAFARYRFPGKRWLRAAFTIPFVMPTVVAGAGFLALVGPNGVLGVDLLDSLALVLLAHVFYNQAVVVRMVGGFLEAAAPNLRSAAATLGAGPLRLAWRVTLPLAAPAIFAAAALVFVFSFTSFGVILILAPGGAWDTLEVEVYRSVARLLRLDVAALLALVQLSIAMVVGGAYTILQARAAVPLAAAPPLPRPGWTGRLVLVSTLLPAVLVTLAPLLALAVRAFVPPGAEGVTGLGWRAAFAPSGLVGVTSAWEAMGNSLRFAAAAGAVAVVMGTAFAYAVVRGRQRWLDRVSLLPLATSPGGHLLGFGVGPRTDWHAVRDACGASLAARRPCIAPGRGGRGGCGCMAALVARRSSRPEGVAREWCGVRGGGVAWRVRCFADVDAAGVCDPPRRHVPAPGSTGGGELRSGDGDGAPVDAGDGGVDGAARPAGWGWRVVRAWVRCRA